MLGVGFCVGFCVGFQRGDWLFRYGFGGSIFVRRRFCVHSVFSLCVRVGRRLCHGFAHFISRVLQMNLVGLVVLMCSNRVSVRLV